MEKKTIAVSGISGYFGRLLRPLLEADEEVGTIFGIDRNPLDGSGTQQPTPGSLPLSAAPSKLVFHQMDIRDPGFEPLLKRSDTFVHLAFQVMRLPSTNNINDINIKGMQAACQAAARQGVRKLVITSSVVAYGLHPERLHPPDYPPLLTEDSPLQPNPGLYYGMAKAGNELFLDDFQPKHPEMVITRLRPCTVAGPRADPAMMASLMTEPTILVWGCNPPVQIVHEDDLAQALHLAIRQDLPGVYNVTSDEPRTLTELVNMRRGRSLALPFFLVKLLMAVAWRSGKSVFAPEWIDLSRYSIVASNAKLKAAGWKPRYTTAQAFLELIRAGHSSV